jgi:hypothetical protein
MHRKVTIGVIVVIVLLASGYDRGRPVTRHDGSKEGVAGSIPAINAKSFGDGTLFAQAPPSNRCVTPTFYCYLQQYVPVGTACWCATPYGPVAGVVR